jgi:hypothetical protein
MAQPSGDRVLSKKQYFAESGYRPHRGQQRIHYDPSRFRVVSNGRRWGKTIMGGREVEPHTFVLCPITGEPQVGWIVGPQYTDAEREFAVVWNALRKAGIEPAAPKFQRNVDSGALHIKTSWGFELIGKSARHPDTLTGEGLNFVLMVEAGRHRRRTWGDYIRPSLSDRRGWAMFTGVPEGKSEHSLLYSLWQRGQDARYKPWSSWRMPSWTNNIVFPGGRNDPEIVDAATDLTKNEFDRQYGAQFVEKVGAVMQDWDDETHLGNLGYTLDWPLYAAVDYGFTNDFVWLWIQVGPYGHVRVIGERRWKRQQTGEIAKDILAEYGAYVRKCVAFYPDPAEPDRTMELENKLHIPARGGTGGTINSRLELIWKGLKVRQHDQLPHDHPDNAPMLLVDRSCVQLAWEMREGYRWPEHRSEVKSESETPLDKDNHGPEALGRFYKGFFDVTGVATTRVRKAKVG